MTNANAPLAAPTADPTAADPRTWRLLDAAKAAFLDLGYSAASMDLVAQRARVSKTTLYTRFASKEALFAATIARECQSHGMGFSPETFDGWPLAAALEEIGDRFLRLIWSPEALRINQVVTGEALRQPHIGRIFFDTAVTPRSWR
jgi:TetR/AcrR family transcriptional repressor of mexJK operon